MPDRRDLTSGWPNFLRLPIVPRVQLVGDPGNPVFEDSWDGLAGFYKDAAARRVYLNGDVTADDESAGSTIFTLPDDHLPQKLVRFACPAHDSANDFWIAAVVKVTTGGVVSLDKMTDFSGFVKDVSFDGVDVSVTFNKAGKCDQLHLDGISFLAL